MYEYKWAVNRDKLAQAVAWAKAQAKVNAEFVVNEASIKARYVKLAGKLNEVAVVKAKTVRKPAVKKVAVAKAKKVK